MTHLDAGIVIALLDADDAHHEAATHALGDVTVTADRLAMAASAYAECLVGPSRRGPKAVETVRQLFERLPVDIVDLDGATAERAALLRARHPSLRLPDALVLATAAQESADRLMTTDRRWPRARTLGLTTEIVVL